MYEDDHQLLIVDPNAEPLEISLSDFRESWQPYGQMAIVVQRKVEE